MMRDATAVITSFPAIHGEIRRRKLFQKYLDQHAGARISSCNAQCPSSPPRPPGTMRGEGIFRGIASEAAQDCARGRHDCMERRHDRPGYHGPHR